MAGEFSSVVDLFLASGDKDFEILARHAERLFEDPSLAPRFDVAAERDALEREVLATFPTPFAGAFESWTRKSRAFAEADTLDESDYASRFGAAFDDMWACWLQIVHFLPFIFLVSLTRLPAALRERGGRTLVRAFKHYDRFYRVGEGETEAGRAQYESEQRQLLEVLIEFCSELSKPPGLPDSFFLNPLLGEARDFTSLFPRRFARELDFLQHARNRVVHGKAGKRGPELLGPICRLLEAAFLDVVSILAPFSRRYGLYYVTGIDETVTPAEAVAWSFAGTRGSMERFRISTGGAGVADVDKFVPRRIYMIDRQREHQPEMLRPPDYIDLTPYLVEVGRFDANPDERKLRLYGLSEYRATDQDRFIWFLELAGTTTKRLPLKTKPTDYERRELAELVPELERLGVLVEGLEDYILQARRGSIDFPIMRQRAWDRVSRRHLEATLDVRRYDYTGQDLETSGARLDVSYERELFAAPAQARDIDAFFASDKLGLLLIGGSGYGKTTLLAHTYLERLRAGDVALFLGGRTLSGTSLREMIAEVASTIQFDWTPETFAKFVADENAARRRDHRQPTQLTIFIDAINEYTSGGGAVALLDEVIGLVHNGGEAMFAAALPAFRIVASCRSETWTGYLERKGSQALLNPNRFSCSGNGDPITVSGFDDEASRSALYEKYRTSFHLSPERYGDLSPMVAELFRVPLMLALVAQTYGHVEAEGSVGAIPADLNYYALFGKLKQRKLADAAYLIPAGDRRSHFQDELRDCLFAFAGTQYERMTSSDSPRDYVVNSLTATGPIAVFKNDRADRQLTAFRALLDIGLLTMKLVPERDYNENETTGRAYAFFHDRYAEYEIAAVYNQAVLKKLTKDVIRDPRVLQKVADEIARLIGIGVEFPVLDGAIEHWFHMNLVTNDGRVAALIPLCNRLSASESGAVRAAASRVLTGFVARGVVEPKKLYDAVFSAALPLLRIDLASAYADAWPGIGESAPRALINACDSKRDEFAIETLAGVFAEHVNANRRDASGASAIDFVARVMPDFAWGELFTLDGVRRLDQLKNHLAFLVQFVSLVIVGSSDGATLLELRDFLRNRFRPLVDILLGQPTGNVVADFVPGKVRGFFRERFERTMYAGWEDAISCDGVNDRFFTDDGSGFVQRDLLREYLPYMCAMHNGDDAMLSLAPGSPFRALTLKMLSYRQYSIVGYAAYTVVTIALRENVDALRELVLELTGSESPAGRFVAVNVIEAYSLLHPTFGVEALRTIEAEMLPQLLDDRSALPHLLVCAAGIVEDDIEGRWEHFEPALDIAFARLGDRSDPDEMVEFGRQMRCVTFSNDIRVGTRLLDYLLRAGHLNEYSPWRQAALEICAGMLARRRAELARLFAQYAIPESVIREAEALKSQAVLDQQRTFGARARWNRFFLRTIAFNTKVRYLLLKHMLGFIALCNEMSEWATQMGTFMIEALRVYAYDEDDEERYARLTVDDIYASTSIRPEPGGGKVYVPRRGVRRDG